MKIIKKYLFVLALVLSFSCKRDKIDAENSDLDTTTINTLLAKAKDNSIEEKNRIAYADSVFVLLKKANSDTVNNKYYFKLANRYFNLNELEKYKKIAVYINQRAIKNNDTLSIAKSYNYLGDYYYKNYALDSCYYNYFNAQKYSNYIRDTDLKIEINNSVGKILNYQSQFLESEKHLTKALDLAKKTKNYRYIYDCDLFLGLTQLGLKNYNKALDYFALAENALNNLKNDSSFIVLKAQVYIGFCNTYLQMEDYKNVLVYSKKGLLLKNIKNIDLNTYAYLKNYYGYAKLKLHNKSAIYDFNEALKIGDSLAFYPIQNTSNLHLAEYYMFVKDTIKAIKLMQKVNIIAKKNLLVDDELKVLQLLAIAEPTKNYHFKRIVFLKDSLINIERKTREKFSRIAYETDQISKEKDVLEIDKNKLLSQRWIVGTTVLFFVFLMLFYFYTRIQKNKTKELIYIKEQEESNVTIYELMLNEKKKIEEGKLVEKQRISKELHDGVMGKLTSIRLNLFVLGKRTDKESIEKCLNHIKDIQDIEKEIRNIAHDLNKNIFAENIDFVSIVKNLCASIENHSNIEFSLKVDEQIDIESLESNKKMQIYRVLQEALLNIDKYAKAKKVIVSMKKEGHSIIIGIEDDGIGFDIEKPRNGIGLKNMSERMKSIKGAFTINSIEKKGTKINLTIPA